MTDLSDTIPLDAFQPSPDRMPAFLTRYQTDRDTLERRFTAPYSARRRERLLAFLSAWQEALEGLPFDSLTRSDRADWLLFRNLLQTERRRLEREAQLFAEMERLIPFAALLIALEDDRRDLNPIEPAAIAERLDQAVRQVGETRGAIESRLAEGEREATLRPAVAGRAADALDRIGKALAAWYGFHHGYAPLFTWWVEKPYHALVQALSEYAAFLRERVAGMQDSDTILGDPIGRDALLADLEYALIPYTPEELLDLARREQDWCLQEMRRAADELGFGEDWRAALEQVKSTHVAPGEQPALVRELAEEAIRYVEEHDLVTVPPLARECWRMEMMSPEKQKVNPFFLGGEAIIVSFPTDEMEHAQKRMSLRGNNRAFSRATVQHELIPGHHLQGFSQERYRPYRRIFGTPFWTEGWTLHWEMLLWERGFASTPEERMGMLFWRLHRCVRILFSIGFHLGHLTPQECVEMLVNDVGHERDNALAEVRRSFGGDYPPLYQCAYLIGGLQVHALYRELVGSGQMSDREFHDAMLQENCMPIAMLRALMAEMPLERAFPAGWRFYPLPGI